MITNKRERERESISEVPQWVRVEEDNLDQEFINFWKELSTPQISLLPGMGLTGNCAGVNAVFRTWICPQCKVEITSCQEKFEPGKSITVSEKNSQAVRNHVCQTCSKCGKLSSFQDLQLHEIYECESQQAQPSSQIIQQQIIQINQVINKIQNLANKIQVASQKINNNPSLAPQQKQQALSELNNPASGLANLLADCQAKQNKLNALATNPQSGNNPSKSNYLPWVIGGMLGMGAIIGLIVWLAMKNKKNS